MPLSALSGKSVVITGGCGFIGSHFVEVCHALGMHITVLDNMATGHNVWSSSDSSSGSSGSVSYVFGDITDAAIYDRLPSSVDYVVHLAASISVIESMSNPAKYDHNNRVGSEMVYRYCLKAGACAVVSATSAAVYGDCGTHQIEESFPYKGISPYARSKYDMEEVTRHLASSPAPADLKRSIHFFNTRFFNVYGPRQDPSSPYTGVMSIFMDRALANKEITIYGDGSQTRDFVYVGDVVDAALSLFASVSSSDHSSSHSAHSSHPTISTSVFNIGTGHSTSINDLASAILSVSGSSSHVSHGPAREGDIVHSMANVSAIHKAIGWSSHVSLSEGMKKTWAWFSHPNASSSSSKHGLRLVDPKSHCADVTERASVGKA